MEKAIEWGKKSLFLQSKVKMSGGYVD